MDFNRSFLVQLFQSLKNKGALSNRIYKKNLEEV